MSEPRIIRVGEEPPALEPTGRKPRPASCGPSVKTPKRPRAKGATARRFGLLNAIADGALPRIGTRTALTAWLILFRHAKPDGTVTASVGDLARRSGCSYSGMRGGLRRLQAAGLVVQTKRGTLAGGPSVWQLLTPEGERP